MMVGQGGDPGRHVVVVGASLAGTRCVQALRSAGQRGPITLIGAEPHVPYDRPPLSKGLLTGEWSEDAVDKVRLTTADDLARLAVDLRLGVPAEGLDTDARAITLADGSTVAYDVLVVATGARPRPSPWQPLSGLHLLRTLDDSRAISARLALGEPVVVVGGGFIGTEVAAAARRRGCQVTVVDPVPAPMARLVGPEIADALVRLHHRHGTATHFGAGVTAVDGAAGSLAVHVADGTSLHASTVIVGIGAQPMTAWLDGSGVELDDGVRCDARLRALGVDDIYAIGDVARWHHSGQARDVRSEHWTNAVDQARYVAGEIAGEPAGPYRPSDYVWSDQYDWKVQSVGWRAPDGGSIVLGDVDADGRSAVVHADAGGVACGAVTVNWPRALLQCRRLLAEHVPASALVDALRASVG